MEAPLWPWSAREARRPFCGVMAAVLLATCALVCASTALALQLTERRRVVAPPSDEPCEASPFAWPCAPSLEQKIPAAPLDFERVMVVTAHPDDEASAAGLLALLARRGKHVVIVVCTNGDKGSTNTTVSRFEILQMLGDARMSQRAPRH